MANSSVHSGYMTVELVVTLVVGAMLVLSLNTISVSHSYLTRRSRNTVAANAFAEQKIEALRSAGYLGISNGTTDISSELPATLSRPKSASLAISSHTAALRRVHLSISYHEQGSNLTKTYTTYIGELGVGQY